MELQESAVQTSNRRKPIKIAGKSRKFKGVVASTLQELKRKALSSLGSSLPLNEAHLYLEEDGTEIDDEEYFQFLQDDTRMIILPENDFDFVFVTGSQKCHSVASFERSESQVLVSDGDVTDAGNQLPQNIITTLKTNPTFFVQLSQADLDVIADLPIDELAKMLESNISESRIIQEACTKELDRRRSLREATDLLSMYQKAADEAKHLSRKKPNKMHE